MPFPPTWPTYIPKDMLANWFVAYVKNMELNYWPGTSLARQLRRRQAAMADHARAQRRTTRVMRPGHLILATGVSSIPFMSDLPGLDSSGTVMHSGSYTDGKPWQGKRALVLGSGNSGHDVAHDLCSSGADVIMIQRSPTYIVSLKESVYAIYSEGIPFENCDLLATSFPFPVLRSAYQLSALKSWRVDRKLLSALERRGFRLHFGADETGFQMMYLRQTAAIISISATATW